MEGTQFFLTLTIGPIFNRIVPKEWIRVKSNVRLTLFSQLTATKSENTATPSSTMSGP